MTQPLGKLKKKFNTTERWIKCLVTQYPPSDSIKAPFSVVVVVVYQCSIWDWVLVVCDKVRVPHEDVYAMVYYYAASNVVGSQVGLAVRTCFPGQNHRPHEDHYFFIYISRSCKQVQIIAGRDFPSPIFIWVHTTMWKQISWAMMMPNVTQILRLWEKSLHPIMHSLKLDTKTRVQSLCDRVGVV